MRQFCLAWSLLLAAATPTALVGQRPADPAQDEVRDVIVHFAEHIQSGDLAELAALFPARGVHILVDGSTTHGWAEYRDSYLKAEMDAFPGLVYAHTAVEPVVRGDIAWVAFRRQLSSSAAAVEPVEGRGSAVLEKRDGKWIIVQLHMSR